jgi:beta-lactam-binding protein with PASTA domain
MLSNIFSFLKSRTFFKNIFLLLVILVAGFFSLNAMLNHFTHHGESIAVPDLSGLKITKLDSILVKHNFNYKVVDSLYDGEKIPGTVIDQDPAPGSKVKENRTIYLTINAVNPPDVKMPDLVDVSFRQAQAMLQSFGLVTGDVVYRSDLAKNAVLDQLYKNKTIKPGTMIPKGAVIDLVLGDGLGEIDVEVPDLTGLTHDEALLKLTHSSLSVGVVDYDENVSDKSSAKIYRQNPEPNNGNTLKQGSGVDIFLR